MCVMFAFPPFSEMILYCDTEMYGMVHETTVYQTSIYSFSLLIAFLRLSIPFHTIISKVFLC